MLTKNEAYEEISKLIERFCSQYDEYKKQAYNETQARIDFIDPFFMALGWDVNNKNGFDEKHRDVIHEDKIRIGDRLKSPDYSFRAAGVDRIFFVEAKKPSVYLKNSNESAYQIRRYGWNAGLAISVITNFEEIAVYDCGYKPKITDKAATARIKYLTFREYLAEFDFIWDTFSKDGIHKGKLDRFIKSDSAKKGKMSVDAEFLSTLDNMRIALAKSIAKMNRFLDEEQLNHAVQRLVNRIVFLRMAEDRKIEPREKLKSAIGHGDYYKNLFKQFQQADKKYDSGLFDFREDRISGKINIGNEVVKKIISDLYFPKCPFEFRFFPADILGTAYEQFLGKVIHVNQKHDVVIREKPEIRKAGGVYYTPRHIVEHIVGDVVGRITLNKSPRHVSRARILDPACGSGSFLLGAYQHLLEWHREYYAGASATGKLKSGLLTNEGKLTTKEKRRILLDNIWGVDIDANAVEVTKLNLWLKCMEDETEDSIARQLSLFNERALPALAHNIKCGNAILSTDFYDKRLPGMPEESEKKTNTFNWQTEFKQVFSDGGFDAVIGNPPYVFTRGKGFTDAEKEYYARVYQKNYQLNTYVLFVEKGGFLLKQNGRLGFIIPNNWLTISSMKPFRNYIARAFGDVKIVNNAYKVFSQANIDTSLLFFSKRKAGKISLLTSSEPGECGAAAEMSPEKIIASESILFDGNSASAEILRKIERVSDELGKIAVVSTGLKAYQVGKGKPPQKRKMIEERIFHSLKKEDSTFAPYLQGRDVKRFLLDWSGEYLSYGEWLAEPRRSVPFDRARILVRQIPSKKPFMIEAAYTNQCFYNDINSMLVFGCNENDLKFILGILNSRLMSYWFDRTFGKGQRGIFPQFKVKELSKFPIVKSNMKNRIVSLVDEMMILKKLRKTLENERVVEFKNAEIDKEVYALYAMTKSEIKNIENNE